jgi:NAD-dependent deacetylase
MHITNKIDKFVELVKNSEKILILTGAGISTESGLPDFRSDDGFWAKNKPIMFQDFLNDADSRRLSWQRNIELKNKLKSIKPNSGHFFVKHLIEKSNKNYLITQNIDGLHEMTGLDKKKIIEIHGNATKASCLNCFKSHDISIFHDAINNNTEIPNCDTCNSLVKVSTISFGQPMNEADFHESMFLSEHCDLFIAIGTSLSVQPVANLPGMAKEHGAQLIIINRDKTPFDHIANLVINDELKNFIPMILNYI